MERIHPLEAVDWDIIEFWLKQVPGYKRSAEFHNPIHKELIRPRYNEYGPLPSMLVLSGGERSGKTQTSAAHMFAMHWMAKTFWIVGERYEDTKGEFDIIRDAAIATDTLSKLSEPQNGPCEIIFKNGCRLTTKSSDDFTTLAGASPDGILMVEAGRQSWQAFRYMWTRCAHATGWMLVSGTFESTKGPWMRDLWNLCQGANEYMAKSVCLPSYANPEVYPEGARDPKIMAIRQTMTDDEFSERFLGIPRPPIGVVFPEFRRSTHVLPQAIYVPTYPVRIWVDPGFSPSSYAVLFIQIVNDQIRVLKEYYTNSKLKDTLLPSSHLESLTNDQMVDLIVNDPLIDYVEKVVIDVAAQAHAGAQVPAVESWRRAMGPRNIPIVGKYVKIDDGIQRSHDKMRMNHMTHQPYMIFNHTCENTIWEIEEGYRYHVNRTGDFGNENKPIDKNNHAVKALAYGIIDAFGVAEGKMPPNSGPTRRRMVYD